MPKLRTHSGTKKRVKTTSTGKLVRGHAFSTHFLGKKRGSRKRTYAGTSDLPSGSRQSVKRQLGA